MPRSPLPLSGWRWVIIIGAIGAVLIWIIRWRPPEAPRRLAQHERLADAERVVGAIEARVAAEYGKRLPPPAPPAPEQPGQGRNLEAFAPDYLNRTIMKVVVSFGSMIGCYGFANRVPTLLRHPRH